MPYTLHMTSSKPRDPANLVFTGSRPTSRSQESSVDINLLAAGGMATCPDSTICLAGSSCPIEQQRQTRICFPQFAPVSSCLHFSLLRKHLACQIVSIEVGKRKQQSSPATLTLAW